MHLKDVTYETLNEKGFADALRKAYPNVQWDKPFNAFDAPRQRDHDGEGRVLKDDGRG